MLHTGKYLCLNTVISVQLNALQDTDAACTGFGL